MSILLSRFSLSVIHKRVYRELEMRDLEFKTTNKIALQGYLLLIQMLSKDQVIFSLSKELQIITQIHYFKNN